MVAHKLLIFRELISQLCAGVSGKKPRPNVVIPYELTSRLQPNPALWNAALRYICVASVFRFSDFRRRVLGASLRPQAFTVIAMAMRTCVARQRVTVSSGHRHWR
ncbi:hypothetical protein Y600_6014 [Burkholderia pseudomallei MSHR3709]|nr:hypothetical protein Y600_6014 [Burkholderia pseudomallei MSHR3709]